jgi:hypothetical protein
MGSSVVLAATPPQSNLDVAAGAAELQRGGHEQQQQHVGPGVKTSC